MAECNQCYVMSDGSIKLCYECLEKRIKELEAVLEKANIALVNWKPEDLWFPEVKRDYDELMEDIEKALKGVKYGDCKEMDRS